MDYMGSVEGIIEEFKEKPVNVMDLNDSSGEYIYIRLLRHSYVRTIAAIDRLLGPDRKAKRIFEIGPFLGVVSCALKRLGYDVSCSDIPEFHACEKLVARFQNEGIDFRAVNLRAYSLPYEDSAFDAVVICEVIEHLNFNPLPVLLEINRIIRKGGYIYITVPNQAYFAHRIRLLFGKSIRNPPRDFFRQLDRRDNMIVGLHWREYTMEEIVEMLEKMGFVVVEKQFWHDPSGTSKNPIMKIIKSLVGIYPPFRTSIVVTAQKREVPTCDFWFTDASS